LDATTQQLGLLVITTALAVTLIVTQFARVRRNLSTLRTIPAYDALPSLAGLAIESNRPMHLAFGASGLGDESTLFTLASAELFYQVSQRAAIGDVSPIITVSRPITLPLGQDVLRRAYQSRNRLSQYRYSSVRWYPYGSRSLAYAAAVTALLGDDRVSTSLFAGRFGTELALMMEAGARRDLSLIGVSDDLEGQAVAYAFSDYVLIGEEIFAAGAYLGSSASQLGATITVDLLRWLLVAALVAALMSILLNGA
jgi:hypothetical protein